MIAAMVQPGPDATYRHNHYVPEWYQRNFMFPGQARYHYLDLDPELRKAGDATWTRRARRLLGPSNCFASDDLYTTR